MNIALLDPGLYMLAGHHYDLDLRLARALTARGHAVTVHGHARPAPELGRRFEDAGLVFVPTFRIQPYFRIAEGERPLSKYRDAAACTAEDLASVADADLWVWPTLSAYQLLAASMHASTVRQIGGAWWLPHFMHPIAADCWRAATRRIAETGQAFRVGAYAPVLCEGIQPLSSGLQIACLPCPHDGAPHERAGTSLRRIGFFGHQRAARGSDLLDELIDGLLARGLEVVLHDSSGKSGEAGLGDRVRVLDFVEDFAAEIARCDAVIWPSRPQAYALTFSGVVSECVASGVPVVMPSGCLPADAFRR